MSKGKIRAGIGGWIFEPWRGVFYPDDLKQKDELSYASRHLTAIEINSTYYSSQKPATFAKWRDETPEGFMFSVKASRYCTNRRVLAEAGESIDKFVTQGVTELGDRLGPIVWQFMATKKFDPDDFEAFLKLLPRKQDGLALRHVMEVRSDTFSTPDFIALCRKHDVAICLADHETFPLIPDVTSDLVYARLMTGVDEVPTAYHPAEIKRWAERFETYAAGGVPDDLHLVAKEAAPRKPRDVFAFFIHEGKVRAPAAAQALIKTLE
ncbi:DUF72 domain-containing protein [Caulobacter sp. NIBR2454]|uniref:DUF72 domain-containing protein n=1 Tax=Caulobacter sp. NIBR2454 TaxID=3015996 RepID=UPI0022B73BD3|nr:DUF72 domain-containing protein [Caulobacter sp. NIBR2454]